MPPFTRLWFATIFTSFGSQFSAIAIPLVATKYLDASFTGLGLIVAANLAPHFIFALGAGLLADRYDRFAVIATCDAIRAIGYVVFILLLIFDLASVGIFVGFAFLIGTFDTLATSAFHAAVYQAVAPEELARANSKLQIGISISQLGGPPVAGMTIQALPAPVALLANPICFLASAFFLISKKPNWSATSGPQRGALVELRFLWAMLSESKSLQLVFLLGMFWQAVFAAHSVLYVKFTLTELSLTPATLGFALTAGAVGTLAGGTLVRGDATKEYLRLVFVAGLLFCGASWATFAHLPLLDDEGRKLGLGAAMFLFGTGCSLSGVGTMGMLQLHSSRSAIGGTIAAYQMLIFSAASISAGLSGFVADSAGLHATFLVLCAAATSVALIATSSRVLVALSGPQTHA
jgi:MFS family permease